MNWQDDPELEQQRYEHGVRNGIIRTAILWTPLFVITAAAFVYFLIDMLTGGNNGTIFLLAVLALFGTLFGFQSIQSLLDLRSSPVQTESTVTRRWARTDSFVMRSHYIKLATKQILRGDVIVLDGIQEGDRVLARYYPHTAVLVSVEKLPALHDGEDAGRA